MLRPVRHLAGLVPLIALVSSACATAPNRRATSVVDYLYPDRRDITVEPSVPVLSLPLKVGIAFVPATSRGNLPGVGNDDNVPEAERLRLLREVSAGFKALPFVKSIDIIPSAYMSPRGGFANLEQVQSMFGVDVIALVSYDQVQFSDQSRLSLTYWTLVGAYLVNGEKNETRTLMDAAVYDIKSRKMLFRAPGVSTVKGTAAPVNVAEELRRDSQKGFELAANDLKASLAQQLEEFKTKVKESPADYQVVRRPEYKGGGGGAGAVEPLMLAGLVALAGLAIRRRGRGA
jgi:rhombotail lipoprotein